MWYELVFFFFKRKHCYIIVQSGLKLYDCTILAAGVAANMVKTEFELEQVISMQLQ